MKTHCTEQRDWDMTAQCVGVAQTNSEVPVKSKLCVKLVFFQKQIHRNDIIYGTQCVNCECVIISYGV